MHAANRAIIIISAVLWIWVLAVLVLLTWAAPEALPGWLTGLGTYLGTHTDTLSRIVLSLALAIFLLLALALIIFELAPAPERSLKVSSVKAGNAVLGTDVIAERIERDVRAVESVTDAKVTAQGRGKGVDVAVDLSVDPDANLSQVSERVAELIRDSVENRMGVALAAPPRVILHDSGGKVASRPAETAVADEHGPRAGA
jgi:hypothetical protein